MRVDLGQNQRGSAGHVCFSRDGKRLAWAASDAVRVWDVMNGREMPSPGKAHGLVHNLDIFPDGDRVVFVNSRRVAEVWDVTAGRQMSAIDTLAGTPADAAAQLNAVGSLWHIRLSPDNRWLAVNSWTGRGVDLWDIETGRRLVALPEEKGAVLGLAWSSDGRHLAVSRLNGDVAIWDILAVRQQLAGLGLDW
jgi:WD40 repeat protein